MRRFTNFKLGGVVLTLLFLLGVSGSSWGQEVSDEIVATECVDLPSGNVTYSNFSDVVGNSGAVYAGRMACTKDGAIQLNNSSSDKGIITTASGGKRVKSIIVEWQSTSSNVLSIYGKTSKYSSAGDLYDTTTQGTLLGSLTKGETTLNVSGDYTYVGFRSKKGALYLNKITIVWETGEATQVAAPTLTPSGGNFLNEVTVKASCTTDGATIYYTKDGSEPTTSSQVFPAEGLVIDATTTVKAIAADGKLENSEVVEATYTKVEALSIAEFKATTGEQFLNLENAVVTAVGSNDIFI